MITHWNEEEIKRLKAKYPKSSKQELIKLFPNRTWWAISKEAQNLGIRKEKIIYYGRGVDEKRLDKIELNEAERGYIAGMVDGEGSIGFMHNKKEERFIPYIRINNTSKKLMRWFKEKLKMGKIFIQVRGFSAGKTNATCYTISVHRIVEIEKMIELIKDYLIIKREQSELMIEFCKIKKTKGKILKRDDVGRLYGWKHTPLTQKEWSLFNEMKKLNMKPHQRFLLAERQK